MWTFDQMALLRNDVLSAWESEVVGVAVVESVVGSVAYRRIA